MKKIFISFLKNYGQAGLAALCFYRVCLLFLFYFQEYFQSTATIPETLNGSSYFGSLPPVSIYLVLPGGGGGVGGLTS